MRSTGDRAGPAPSSYPGHAASRSRDPCSASGTAVIAAGWIPGGSGPIRKFVPENEWVGVIRFLPIVAFQIFTVVFRNKRAAVTAVHVPRLLPGSPCSGSQLLTWRVAPF